MSRSWYRSAVVYSLDLEFVHGRRRRCLGDFAGLLQRLDYLSGLGVTCLWLLPFYPTPNRDDGYDVADPYGIDPRLARRATSWSSCGRRAGAGSHTQGEDGMRHLRTDATRRAIVNTPNCQIAFGEPQAGTGPSPRHAYSMWASPGDHPESAVATIIAETAGAPLPEMVEVRVERGGARAALARACRSSASWPPTTASR